ncbi:MAG: hypothetical protein WC781_02700 [Candidatus Pacearchaeota archaeon]|jgi:hypothetical protein
METQTKIQANKRAQTSIVPYETEDYALHETGQDSYTNISYDEELKSNREFLGEVEKKLIEYAEDPCETMLGQEKKKNDLESIAGTEGNLSSNGKLREPGFYDVVKGLGKDTYNVAKAVVESIYFIPTSMRKSDDKRHNEDEEDSATEEIMRCIISGTSILGNVFLGMYSAGNALSGAGSSPKANAYLAAVVGANLLSGAYEIYRNKKNKMMEEYKDKLRAEERKS